MNRKKNLLSKLNIKKSKTNLILGGSGTIGSALCRHLDNKGERTINLDLKNGFDIRKESLNSYKNIDFVWFLAWEVGGAKYLTDEKNLLTIIRNNTQLCEIVFSFLEKTRIPFMFASSQLAAHNTPYGVTKLLGEEWTRLLDGQVVRFWNVYGWENPGERSHVIPDLISQGLIKKKIHLITDGQEERQFIYMDDCVENMVNARNASLSRVDITNGKWVTIEKIAYVIGDTLKVPVFLGKKKGYSNKVEPEFISNKIKFQTSINTGISKVIANAKKYYSIKNF